MWDKILDKLVPKINAIVIKVLKSEKLRYFNDNYFIYWYKLSAFYSNSYEKAVSGIISIFKKIIINPILGLTKILDKVYILTPFHLGVLSIFVQLSFIVCIADWLVYWDFRISFWFLEKIYLEYPFSLITTVDWGWKNILDLCNYPRGWFLNKIKPDWWVFVYNYIYEVVWYWMYKYWKFSMLWCKLVRFSLHFVFAALITWYIFMFSVIIYEYCILRVIIKLYNKLSISTQQYVLIVRYWFSKVFFFFWKFIFFIYPIFSIAVIGSVETPYGWTPLLKSLPIIYEILDKLLGFLGI